MDRFRTAEQITEAIGALPHTNIPRITGTLDDAIALKTTATWEEQGSTIPRSAAEQVNRIVDELCSGEFNLAPDSQHFVVTKDEVSALAHRVRHAVLTIAALGIGVASRDTQQLHALLSETAPNEDAA